MAKNYYLILGVTSNATCGEIKNAFRRRARELHPDHSGLESDPFLEVQEAYGVLADPDRRHAYDQKQRSSSPAPRSQSGSTFWRQARPRGEPIGDVTSVGNLHEASVRESFETYRPSVEELFERLWGNFEGLARPKGEQLQSLSVEMVLSPEEARYGGRVRLWIPARTACTTCGGHGGVGPYQCPHCAGTGTLTVDYPAELEFPPGVRDGEAIRLSLSRFGIQNLYLLVILRVGTP